MRLPTERHCISGPKTHEVLRDSSNKQIKLLTLIISWCTCAIITTRVWMLPRVGMGIMRIYKVGLRDSSNVFIT